ncbi:MAG: hypothetical protein A2381_16140 [Bdellovibrionales bacterium RIFOXYB1_FULL_37_110]|nr:MAG: hypothetical protein A2417_07990 [Bdellovibrionales bacterium RIFOXYC1_FULL_37_79]OFZ57143.1 MAG: hypothetical protein A2381_16140 [Bdellovibrionales bacterium RIFOXYB1_FULL_37_110]OFZ65373.1 MAG: hypothetical protein A2577_03730 [Bdellovibrionales bacterium RIFOXYD1_FULL_36_51]OFZ67624.1 MAG: hypothetical protein A2328_08375 [Bdellovibrionales bacterium RIFOXYB2_FULL_36_6]
MKLFFAILLGLGAFFSHGKEIILISDIDDTLKRTHVLGKFSGGASFDNDFVGLNTLYKILICRKNFIGDAGSDQLCLKTVDEEEPELTGAYYVTGAPSYLHYVGRKFLKKNKFPAGHFYYRPSWDDSTYSFKVETIEEILKEYEAEATEVILLGDNGEKDPAIYETISNHFQNSKLKITTYIHLVYAYSGLYKETGVKPRPGQKMYLTAVDLALDFYLKEWIYASDMMMVYDQVMKKLNSSDRDEIKKVIPGWMKCHEFFDDFKKNGETSNIFKDQMDLYYNKIFTICQKQALELD